MPLLVAFSALAQDGGRKIYQSGSRWVEEISGTLAAAKHLLVKTASGSVTVHGDGSEKLSYVVRRQVRASSKKTAEKIFSAMHFSASSQGGSAILIAEGDSDVTVSAPNDLDLVQTKTQSGDIEVTDIAGRVEAVSAGGHLHLDNIGGSISGTTGCQDVNVGKIGGDIFLRTGGGNVSIDSAGHNLIARSRGGDVRVLASRGDVDIETGGGNIIVKQSFGNLRGSTSGGSISIGDIGGGVSVETGGGSIYLASGNGLVDAETNSGTIQCYRVSHGLTAATGAGGITAEFVGGRGQFADSHLLTSHGDVVVYLPSDLGVDVRAKIVMGNANNIVSEFPGLRVTSTMSADYRARQIFAEGLLNGGGPILNIEATTGNIELRRLKPR